MAQFFILRPVFAIVLSLVILLAGALSIPKLPVAQYPQIAPPAVAVSAVYPGASAKVLEDTVASQIEGAINGAEGMIYMHSTCASTGVYTLNVTFSVDRDLDLATQDISNRLATVTASLPADVVSNGITVKKQSANILQIITLYADEAADLDSLFISNYASLSITSELARLPGVGSVSLFGQRDYSMRIWLKPDQMAKNRLAVEDVVGALREQNLQAASGQIGAAPCAPGTELQYTITVSGRPLEPEAFEKLVLRTLPDGSILRLGDVARCELGAKDYAQFARLNGKGSINIAIFP